MLTVEVLQKRVAELSQMIAKTEVSHLALVGRRDEAAHLLDLTIKSMQEQEAAVEKEAKAEACSEQCQEAAE